MSLQPLATTLDSFSPDIVNKVASQYNKAFHAKLFTLFASSESEVYAFAKLHEPHYDYCFCFMQNDEGQWFLDDQGIARLRKFVLQTCEESPEKMKELHEQWEGYWTEFLQAEIPALKALSDEELYDTFKQYYTKYLLVGSVAYIADCFMSTGETDWLEELLLEKASTKKETVRKLTTPVHLSFTLESEFKLLSIASKVSEKYGTAPPFHELDDESVTLLKKHAQDFFWIQNNYYNVKKIGPEEFYEQVQLLIKEVGDVSAAAKEKEEELHLVRQERDALTAEVESPFVTAVLETAALFAKWKDVRKSGVYIGMHYFDLFLAEVARRTSFTKEDLTFTVFDEIEQILLKKEDFSERIALRKERCFFAVTPKGYLILDDPGKLDPYFAPLTAQPTENVVEIRGVVACPGTARGRVRVIRKTDEMNDFQEGEILVTNQTTPEFVPIMKKAAAIVTEQGGITSHAAVVSRELKKPCVIGTKTATTHLKTGEVVEVDAENGIVRREV